MFLDHEYAAIELRQRGTDVYLEWYTELASRCADVPGDIVELGVYNGDSLAAIARGLPGRTVWAYDSFQGFPPGGINDSPGAHDLHGSSVVGDPRFVVEKLAALPTPPAHIQVETGWFQDSFQRTLPDQVAFLSVDCDLYESVILSLSTFAHLVQPGGIITVDDWGCFIGARRAFYDWCSLTGEAPLLRTFGPTQVWWQVGERGS